MAKTICFNSNIFFITTSIIIVSIATLFIYYKITEDKRIEVFCKNRFNELKNLVDTSKSTLNSITPQIIKVQQDQHREYYPERRYTGKYDYNISSQQAGYIYNSTERLPLYVNRSGRNYYYHVIDDSRNGIRIPLNDTNTKHEEFNDGDTINAPELNGTYTVKLYDYSGTRYNPFNY